MHRCFAMGITISQNAAPTRICGSITGVGPMEIRTNYSSIPTALDPREPASPCSMSPTMARASPSAFATGARMRRTCGSSPLGAARELPDRLPLARYSGFAFRKDGNSFYYTLQSRDSAPRVLYHTWGTDISKDVEVFGKGFAADTWVNPVVSEDGHYLLFSVQRGWAQSDLYVQDLKAGTAIQPVIKGLNGKFEQRFPGFPVCQDRLAGAEGSHFAHRSARSSPGEMARSRARGQRFHREFCVFGGKLFVNRLHNVTSRIAIFSLDGAPLGTVDLPGHRLRRESYGRADQDEGLLYFSSYTTPYSLYRYSAATGARRCGTATRAVRLGTIRNRAGLVSLQGRHAHSYVPDPSQGSTSGRQTPTILYGYGGFNVSITPSSTRVPPGGLSTAGSMPLPISAAAASSAKNGIAPACWIRSRMCSTILSPRRNG